MDSMSDPFTDLDINAKAQLSILEVCREVAPNVRIAYASTRRSMGDLTIYQLMRTTLYNLSM